MSVVHQGRLGRLLACALSLFAGCSDFREGGRDASSPTDVLPVGDSALIDAGSSDTGTPDTLSTDTGPLDGGPMDSGSQDSSVRDTGSLDTGVLDTGAMDVGPADTGPRDAPPEDASGDGCVRCGAGCAELLTDPSNCGRCGSACSAAAVCDRGRCVEASNWARRYGGDAWDEGHAVAVGGAGDVVVAGRVRGDVNFGAGLVSGDLSRDSLAVVAHTRLGALIWARRYGGITGHAVVYGVAIGPDAEVCVVGSFTGTLTIDARSVVSEGQTDGYVACFSNVGALRWLTRMGGAEADEARGISLDSRGDPYVTGSFRGTASFGPRSLTSLGPRDGFVAAYSSSGMQVWATRFGATTSAEGRSVRVDRFDQVWLAGSYQGTADWGGARGYTSLEGDGFAAMFGNTGRVRWVRPFGSSGASTAYSVAFAPDETAWVSGDFQGAMNPGSGALTSSGRAGALVHLAVDGRALGAQVLEATGGMVSYGLATDAASGVWLAGAFQGSARLGAIPLVSAGLADAFAAHVRSDGVVDRALRLGGSGWDNADDVALGGGQVLVSGRFTGAVDFGSGPWTARGADGDLFVVALRP